MTHTPPSPEALARVLSQLGSLIQSPRDALLAELQSHLATTPFAERSRSLRGAPRTWHRQIKKQLDDAARALLLLDSPPELYSNASYHFLFLNADFVTGQLREMFSHIEGSACSADKARTVCAALAAHWREAPLGFERTVANAPSFAQPGLILQDAASAVAFLNAIEGLYWGRNEAYLRMTAGFLALRDNATA